MRFQNFSCNIISSYCNLNDDVLAARQSLQFVASADMYLVLIPVIGAVSYHDDKGNEAYLVAGYVQMFAIAKETVFGLLNPYHDEAVNFLQFWIKNESIFTPDFILPVQVDFDKNINCLQTVLSHPQFFISLGKFGGKEENGYVKRKKDNGIFSFFIDGQMEVQYHLLGSRDGLAL